MPYLETGQSFWNGGSTILDGVSSKFAHTNFLEETTVEQKGFFKAKKLKIRNGEGHILNFAKEIITCFE